MLNGELVQPVRLLKFLIRHIYDAVSDVVESGVHLRSNFQIGSRVLKIVINLLLCISMTYNVISCIEVALHILKAMHL